MLLVKGRRDEMKFRSGHSLNSLKIISIKRRMLRRPKTQKLNFTDLEENQIFQEVSVFFCSPTASSLDSPVLSRFQLHIKSIGLKMYRKPLFLPELLPFTTVLKCRNRTPYPTIRAAKRHTPIWISICLQMGDQQKCHWRRLNRNDNFSLLFRLKGPT